MLFVNRWIVSLLVAMVMLDGGVQAYRYYKRMGNRFQPVMMRPMPVGRFGFVRAENPNADEPSGEKGSDTAPPQESTMDVMAGHEMHAPEMREMIHDSPHPVEIDMGPGMQARVMGFEGELDGAEGNFGRAAEDGEENEEGGSQFRHFKHKHKKHKFVIHTHHHYHHKKGGHGYGHHHDSYGHGHGHGHGGGHGYHGGHHDDEGDDYEPTYGHHGRYRRSPVSEMSSEEGLTPDAQALDRTALTHSSPDHSHPMVPASFPPEDPSTPTSYRQSVSRRQLVRSKNERLAQIGRDRAQRANSPHETIVRAVRNLVFDRHNPRITDPFGGMKPTDSAADRRRQRQEVRRRMNDKPQARPIDAIKNAISSIRQRVTLATTTPVPTTVASKRGRPGRGRRNNNGRSPSNIVGASLATPPPPPPPPAPAPINCAECRRLCNPRGRARSRPLNVPRRPGGGAIVSNPAPADEGIVASAGPAAGAPMVNWWNGLFGNSDGMVASAGPEGQDPAMWRQIVDFFAVPQPGMVASAKDQDTSGPNFWQLLFASEEESVGAARKYPDENLPFCEDIAG